MKTKRQKRNAPTRTSESVPINIDGGLVRGSITLEERPAGSHRFESNEPEHWIPKHWTFESNAVASRFDRHVREQLPWYDHLLGCIEHFGAHYIQTRGTVYDVGASTGNVGRRLAPYLLDRQAHLVSIEPSKAMLEQARALGLPPGEWKIEDALSYEFLKFDFAVVNLVLMFMPSPDRCGFIRGLAEKVRPGGALVVVDKVISPGGYLGTVMRRLAMKWKLEAGATAEEILEKELSLGGVQRPINPAIIPVNATRFFQFGEFVGWIYERGEEGLG